MTACPRAPDRGNERQAKPDRAAEPLAAHGHGRLQGPCAAAARGGGAT